MSCQPHIPEDETLLMCTAHWQKPWGPSQTLKPTKMRLTCMVRWHVRGWPVPFQAPHFPCTGSPTQRCHGGDGSHRRSSRPCCPSWFHPQWALPGLSWTQTTQHVSEPLPGLSWIQTLNMSRSHYQDFPEHKPFNMSQSHYQDCPEYKHSTCLKATTRIVLNTNTQHVSEPLPGLSWIQTLNMSRSHYQDFPEHKPFNMSQSHYQDCPEYKHSTCLKATTRIVLNTNTQHVSKPLPGLSWIQTTQHVSKPLPGLSWTQTTQALPGLSWTQTTRASPRLSWTQTTGITRIVPNTYHMGTTRIILNTNHKGTNKKCPEHKPLNMSQGKDRSTCTFSDLVFSSFDNFQFHAVLYTLINFSA